jgi:Glyoxalase-like domain
VSGVDIRNQCMCVDSVDPRNIASFWEVALGWRRTFDEVDQVCIEPPAGSPEDGVAPDILFLRVPEGS